MHSEHISNPHPGWVVGGWLVAVGDAGVVFLTLVGTGLLLAGEQNGIGGAAAVAVGFFVGGIFLGLRRSNTPSSMAGPSRFCPRSYGSRALWSQALLGGVRAGAIPLSLSAWCSSSSRLP